MSVTTQSRTLLWYCPQPARSSALRRLEQHWAISWCDRPESFLSRLDDACVVMIVPPCDDRFDPVAVQNLLKAVDMSLAVAVVMLPLAFGENGWLSERHGQFIPLDSRCSDETLLATVESAAALQKVIADLRGEVAGERGLGKGIAASFQQLDEELRLAARLQRDFLPHKLPVVGPVHFATLFRPLGWVSGDIYDVTRLDETHVGFYVADAVGHGMPAALLTMFIKKALQTKKIAGHSYQIVPPDEAMGQLNLDICQHNLSGCQFCTSCYAILDTQTLELCYARGGHPSPILLRGDGSVERLETPGPLLGVFPDEQFPSKRCQLRPGDRLVMFSDGVEDTLVSPQSDLLRELRGLRELSADELVLQLTLLLEDAKTVSRCEDDITVVVMDIDS